MYRYESNFKNKKPIPTNKQQVKNLAPRVI